MYLEKSRKKLCESSSVVENDSYRLCVCVQSVRVYVCVRACVYVCVCVCVCMCVCCAFIIQMEHKSRVALYWFGVSFTQDQGPRSSDSHKNKFTSYSQDK